MDSAPYRADDSELSFELFGVGRVRKVIVEMRALVIDDEPQVRKFVATVLTSEGWQVQEADTAERAFDMLRDTRWSLVFCDVMLGGADGFCRTPKVFG